MIEKFKKKPVVIEAMQLTHDNLKQLWEWLGDSYLSHEQCIETGYLAMNIKTLEGQHIASQFDYVIKGIQGEFYPCKPDIFRETYEKV